MKNKIKIVLVDDHLVVRAGFKMLLAAGDSVEVIGEAERGEQAIQLYQELQPDMLVMDLSMPGIGGLETIRRIIQRDSEARILVFSVHHEQVYVSRALAAGARGYITKNSAPGILAEAIAAIMSGQQYVERGLVKSGGEERQHAGHQTIIAGFSPREFDVFSLLAQGLTVHKIADQLCLGHKTVANYATQIKKKLQVDTTTELAHIAVNLGMTAR
ncbi:MULTISPECIES: response regulator transcription factor [Methylomonas]|uniref:LuxR family transcriptional regulator n=2 Tax=Methylomonas TaxID=416 RepID=A0A140E6E3_9GAMM|nr:MULTISPECIES: response regulator transcription factor [Methylomonas]AMK78967.1 LuxR family transcriptional regulator [Methylomonas denitrificans]OAH99179.1 DNA-binding response regulator [Methylomonas methanica]TCV77456.1 LuxR family two component transcriptional regulator [Methylomonas methanica]